MKISRFFALFLAALFFVVGCGKLSLPSQPLPFEGVKNYVVYYGGDEINEQMNRYNFAVVDSDYQYKSGLLHKPLCYFSLTEAEEWRGNYLSLKKSDIFLPEKPEWQGHHYVDVRNEKWKDALFASIDKAIYTNGNYVCSGLFLDGMDYAIMLDESYQDFKDAAVGLLKSIRASFPEMNIMMNRGFEVLPDVASDIDAVMLESVFIDGEGREVPESERNSILGGIAKIKQEYNKNIKIFSLDYHFDDFMIYRIQNFWKEKGVIPYVAPDKSLQVVAPFKAN